MLGAVFDALYELIFTLKIISCVCGGVPGLEIGISYLSHLQVRSEDLTPFMM